MLRLICLIPALLLTSLCTCLGQAHFESRYLHWETIAAIPTYSAQNDVLGIAGPITGVHNNVLIVGGGANFPIPQWENEKMWLSDIWIYPLKDEAPSMWLRGPALPHPLAYSAVTSHDVGVIVMGGSDGETIYDKVFLIKWNSDEEQIRIENLPPLPSPCVNGSSALIDNMLYVAGGQSTTALSTAMNNFWRLDLAEIGSESLAWEVLPAWPGPPRAYNITIAQHNGYNDCIYVLSGRNQAGSNKWNVLTDMYMYDPLAYAEGKDPWSAKASIPAARMGGTGMILGQSHFCILSGADGTLYEKSDSLKENHPGFPTTALCYNTITDEWFSAGEIPQNQLTSHAIQNGDQAFLVSGEIKPRIRSPKIWTVTPVKSGTFFGTIDVITVIFYLLILVGIGIYFAGRTSTTEDFFRGSQKIPWWAAGCSIFATMLSSITFMAVPAKTYATDWLYFIINMMILAVAPFIIYFVLPFFRRINLTSAYEYLELRFNLACRLFASTCYILFQLGRMAIVLFLPALALASVTTVSVETSILIMGMLSIIYCTLGGIQAVIWTDTLQTFVLLGGAGLSLLIILLSPSIDVMGFIGSGILEDKMKLIDWNWSYTEAVAWIVFIGGIGQALVPYASDQGVIQRYMSVSSKRNAEKSIWLNAALSTIATILFFCLGTALFLYYKSHPEELDPTYPIDAVFPLFIAQKLPTGVAGLVIAGIFAAAQSTVSTSMNSISTALLTDFLRRFNFSDSEKIYLRSARVITVLAGLIGVGLALLVANANVKSLWDLFIGVLGLFGGSICGLFFLGMFTTRANGISALIGALIGACLLWVVQQYSDVSFLLYASIGILSTFFFGWIGGFIGGPHDKDLQSLTIFTMGRGQSEEKEGQSSQEYS